MSARGTMRSSRRRSRRLRMFLSIRLSSGEKPVSTAAPSSRTLRSDRIEVGLQPNTARSMRLSHDSRFSRASPFERRASLGKSRWPAVETAESAIKSALGSAMASKSDVGIAPRVGVGNADPGQDVAFQTFHPRGFVLHMVIVSYQVQEAMHHQMRKVV